MTELYMFFPRKKKKKLRKERTQPCISEYAKLGGQKQREKNLGGDIMGIRDRARGKWVASRWPGQDSSFGLRTLAFFCGGHKEKKTLELEGTVFAI